MKNIFKAKILENKEINKNIFLISFSKPENFEIIPGQFINLLIDEFSYDPFLRRPFSIFNVERDKIYVLYQLKGKGTKILSEKRKFETIDFIGPLGNNFSLNLFENNDRNKNIINIFVAGGIGIASLCYFSKYIKNNFKNYKIKNILFYGARSIETFVNKNLYKKYFDDFYFSFEIFGKTNNNLKYLSKDKVFTGNIIEFLKEKESFFEDLAKLNRLNFFVCGPDPMLKSFIKWNSDKNYYAELSLESFMGCGFKACLGCAVMTKSGEYKYVCHDGPVFNYEELRIE